MIGEQGIVNVEDGPFGVTALVLELIRELIIST
jgi:hypothetical protein